MKYVVFLRGINVGGNGQLKMSELKETLEKEGFENVRTYINSGNVVFETKNKSIDSLTKQMDKLLSKTFFPLETVVLSYDEVKTIAENVPKSWKSEDVRKYIAVMISPAKPADVISEVQLREGVDEMNIGHRVVYMTTKMEGLTKSGFTKMASKPIYKKMTIRNYNTLQKILQIMES